jgi:hypothetical protein
VCATDGVAEVIEQMQFSLGEGPCVDAFHHGPGASVYAEVHQATGMISDRLDVGLDDAFVRLRAHAFAAERPVHDVSRHVVAGRVRFDDEDRDD